MSGADDSMMSQGRRRRRRPNVVISNKVPECFQEIPKRKKKVNYGAMCNQRAIETPGFMKGRAE